MTPKILTIGVYGFTESTFFDALQSQQVDLFCDVRQRRGLRGRDYAFANSVRLQKRLAELGIVYFHWKDLAPSKEVRQRQQSADKAVGVQKRARRHLSPQFVEAYQAVVLDNLDPQLFLETVGSATVIALFCVEREPEACHRSLLADHLGRSLNLEIDHILP